MERSIFSDRMVFVRAVRESGWMGDVELVSGSPFCFAATLWRGNHNCSDRMVFASASFASH